MAKRRSSGLALGLAAATAAGLAVFALTRSAKAAAPAQPGGDPTRPPAPPSSDGSPAHEPVGPDPLPEYALTQTNVISSVIEFTESGQVAKLKSLAIKSLTAPAPMRAYLIAALAAVPEQLKADVAFVRQFEQDESKRIKAIEELNSQNDAILRATEAVVVTVATKVNVVAGAVAALGVALGEAARAIILKVTGGIPRRRGADQIYPLHEGDVMRRGVLFQPNMPYLTKADIELSHKLRNRWFDESAVDPWFAALPVMPKGTELRFAPRWDDWVTAVRTLKQNGIDYVAKVQPGDAAAGI